VNPSPTSTQSTTPADLPLARGLRWLREQLQAAQDTRSLPPPRKPPRRHFPAPRRGWFAGWWSARIAAGSGVAIEEFLRHRLARYLAALTVPPDRLPVAIGVEDGGLVVAAPRPGAERARPAWLDGYLRTYGSASVQSDVHLAQAELAHLSTALHEQHARLEQAKRDVDQAAREPSIAELDGGSAEGLGRPAVPAPWGAGLHAFGFALLLAEAWQLAMPVLSAAGVRTGDLRGELVRAPAAVVLGAVFALGAAVSLFYFADLALRHGLALVAALPAPRRARWTALGAAAALGFAGAVSWSIAGLRPGAAPAVDARYARFTLFLLALALPLTTSCLLQVARRLQAARAEARRAAVAWDQAHFRALAEWNRKASALTAELRERARLEVERAAATRRLRALRQRAQLAERHAAEAAEAEALELDRLCHAITSALELDRYEFLRHGAGRAAQPLPQQGTRRAEAERTSLGLAG
jgi:hypothetical protein